VITNQQRIQAIAERIIAFGLADTTWTPENMRRVAKVANLSVTWTPVKRCSITLIVDENKGVVRVRIEARTGKVLVRAANKLCSRMNEVIYLAQEIEAELANEAP
jgi:hypothetical protein